MYIILYKKYKTDKDLQYSTRNYTQYFAISPKRKESEKNRDVCVCVCVCVCVKSLSHVWLFVTPWTVAHQAPLPVEFSRQEYWSGFSFPSPLPHCMWILYHLSHKGSPWILERVAYQFSRGSSRPRNQPGVFCIAGRFFTSWATREVQSIVNYIQVLTPTSCYLGWVM